VAVLPASPRAFFKGALLVIEVLPLEMQPALSGDNKTPSTKIVRPRKAKLIAKMRSRRLNATQGDLVEKSVWVTA
jgi:hypothetical protein